MDSRTTRRELRFSQFGGLNLRAEASGGAIDVLDAAFDSFGVLRNRDAIKYESGVLGGSDVVAAKEYVDSAGRRSIMVQIASTTVAPATWDASGPYWSAGPTVSGTAPVLVGSDRAAAMAQGGPLGKAYFYVGSKTVAIKRYEQTTISAASWTAPTASMLAYDTGSTSTGAMPKCGAICWWPGQERMVYGNFPTSGGGPVGAAADKDTVWFSTVAAGVVDAEKFKSNEFVRVGAGDAENIQAIVAWRDLLFVFKETRFWVFTAPTVDGSGNVRFNRRAVEASAGAVGPRAVAVGRDGVYFVGRKGVYRTTGGEPELLSRDIDPIFTGFNVPPQYSGGVLLGSVGDATNIAVAGDMVYVSGAFVDPSSHGAVRTGMLAFDARFGWWSIYSVNWTKFMATVSRIPYVGVTGLQEVVIGASTAGIQAFDPNQAGDYLSLDQIPTWWVSHSFQLAERKVRTRGLHIRGSGSFRVGLAQDAEYWANAVLDGVDFSAQVPSLRSYMGKWVSRGRRAHDWNLVIRAPSTGSAKWRCAEVRIDAAGALHRAVD